MVQKANVYNIHTKMTLEKKRLCITIENKISFCYAAHTTKVKKKKTDSMTSNLSSLLVLAMIYSGINFSLQVKQGPSWI